ncbi:MAG: bifunctional folylpolyglutamate synthase/dihydrofolate synthase [Muribaculaceae bacterium]|nr:bifunctional folylpolyglutamate synthase/dihydrofolate synthase [Muribaculaceae bacterium]
MEYKEAIDWLFAQLPMFSRVGAAAYKPGLERSEALAAYFGHPERKLKAIHIAGTNGKGSVSNLIAAVLQAQGYKTALYTSPHLVDFRERMRINGRMIPEKKVVDFVERWQRGNYDGDRPSFFELTMMMAFDWFASEQVDYAVIEVGMGGRLDSTNILTPILSVITNISFDHTQFLGDTLAKIAAEKAGIIKPGIPAVIGEAIEETEEVFRDRAAEIGTRLREAYREIDKQANAALNCALEGAYQKKNINTARIAVEELRKQSIAISPEAEKKGFSDVEKLTGFRGRWTKISSEPLIICDTGHNEAGLRYNLEQLRHLLELRNSEATLRFVLGFVSDKDVAHILPMFPKDAVYYTTQAAIPRAMPWAELTERCRLSGLDATGFTGVETAVRAACEDAGENDIIYIGGSTFIVADFLASSESKKS